MSRENVEIVRGLYEAWTRGDPQTVQALLDPEIEWHEPPEKPDLRFARGAKDAGRLIRDWEAAWRTSTMRYSTLRISVTTS